MAPSSVDGPVFSNFSAWYAGYGLIPVAVTLGLAIWAFRNALGGRSLFREGWLDS